MFAVYLAVCLSNLRANGLDVALRALAKCDGCESHISEVQTGIVKGGKDEHYFMFTDLEITADHRVGWYSLAGRIILFS